MDMGVYREDMVLGEMDFFWWGYYYCFKLRIICIYFVSSKDYYYVFLESFVIDYYIYYGYIYKLSNKGCDF